MNNAVLFTLLLLWFFVHGFVFRYERSSLLNDSEAWVVELCRLKVAPRSATL